MNGTNKMEEDIITQIKSYSQDKTHKSWHSFIKEKKVTIIKIFVLIILSNIFFYLFWSSNDVPALENSSNSQEHLNILKNRISIKLNILNYLPIEDDIPVLVDIYGQDKKKVLQGVYLRQININTSELGNDFETIATYSQIYIKKKQFHKLRPYLSNKSILSAYPHINNSEINKLKKRRVQYEVIF